MNLESLGRWCHRRRWVVVALWLAALISLGALAHTAGGELANNISIPGTESQRALDLLEDRFPELGGDTAVIAFKAAGGAHDAAVRARLEDLFDRVARLEHVVAVLSPYRPSGGAGLSRDGRIAFATIQFDVRGPEVPKPVIFEMKRLVEGANRPGLQVELGGESVRFAEIEGPGEREWVGLVAAVVILLIAFGSVVAMGLPIVMAIFGLGIGVAIITLVARVVDLNVFAPQIASMIGLGVGIDYALFTVTRFREGLRRGLTVEDAVAGANATSGRAVVFAGVTVVISLLAMFLTGMPFIYGFAIGPSIAVTVVMLASVTLLPAALSILGPRVDSLRLPVLGRDHRSGALAARWSRAIQRHPWAGAALGLALLLVLAVPVLSIRLGWAGAGSNPDSRTTRRAYDLLAEGFGPGFNEPFLLVAQLPGPGRLDALRPLLEALQRTRNVALVTPPRPNPAGDLAVLTVVPAVAPQDARSSALIRHLREEVVPEATQGSGTRVLVSGMTPVFLDMSELLSERLPLIIGGVIALSFLLLMAVFRSLLVPLKAAVMNLLSIGAAYGVVVAVFQWGWLGELFDIGRAGPIESFAPMMLFAILFGLSMDYEVFLLSRIREEYLRTGDNATAVADGLASTARVITAAAAIMVTLFLSFVLGDERTIKLAGLGLAVAVLVDATLVRMLLVPSTMELLGKANWWLPRWLDALMPSLHAPRRAAETAPPSVPLLPVTRGWPGGRDIVPGAPAARRRVGAASPGAAAGSPRRSDD